MRRKRRGEETARAVRPSAYGELAAYYDRVYAAKEYGREAGILHRLARRYGRPGARTLVDVACGTGEHLRFFRRWYRVRGVDGSGSMLRIARGKLPGVPLSRGDLRSFRLASPVDVVTCLFSAIGYLRSERELRSAFRAFYRALRPGGVALIEPWLDPSQYRPGHIGAVSARGSDWAVARMNVARRAGPRLVMDMHYLIGTPSGIRHWVDRNVCRMTPHLRLLELLREVGFRARQDRRAMPLGRGLLIAVRPRDGSAPGGRRRSGRTGPPSHRAAPGGS